MFYSNPTRCTIFFFLLKSFLLYMFRMSHASIVRSTTVVYSHRFLYTHQNHKKNQYIQLDLNKTYSHLWSVWLFHIISIKGTIKKVTETNSLSYFLCNFIWNIPISKNNWARYKTVRYSCKVPVILARF
jgi:hypothetical protein